MVFQIHDGTIPFLPDGLFVAQLFRKSLAAENLRMYPNDKHLLVIGTIEYADLAAFGSAVRRLLDSPDDARLMGKAGKEYIRENYLGDHHLARWAQLIDAVMGD